MWIRTASIARIKAQRNQNAVNIIPRGGLFGGMLRDKQSATSRGMLDVPTLPQTSSHLDIINRMAPDFAPQSGGESIGNKVDETNRLLSDIRDNSLGFQ
jgi:hypothetical protein